MKTIIRQTTKTTIGLVLLSGAFLCSSARAGWVTWTIASGGNGHQYLAVPATGPLTWNQANQLAQADGGYLATITSAAENNFVFSLIDGPQFFTAYNGSGPAIGGYNAGTPSNPDWSWVTGEAWNYANWLPGEPNYANLGMGPEDRAAFFTGQSSTPGDMWGDLQQNDSNLGGFVVERVPEPGMMALLAIPMIALAGWRRRIRPQS